MSAASLYENMRGMTRNERSSVYAHLIGALSTEVTPEVFDAAADRAIAYAKSQESA